MSERPILTVDPRLLYSFLALAEELHFGRAARRLHVAQPAVSQQLQRLETQLGVQLVARTRHDVRLTAAGEAVLPYVRQAVTATEAIGRVAQDAVRGGVVTLPIGLSPGAHYFAERVLSQFAAEHPGVRVRAIADNTGALAREVAAGRVVVAFGFESTPIPGVVRSVLRRERAILAVGDRHALAGHDRVSLARLAGERFALVDRADGEGYNDAVFRLCRSAGFVPATAEAPSGPMAWETAVRHGGCVGLTTRASAASTLLGIETIALEEDLRFDVELLTPAAYDGDAGPAGSLADVARRLAGTG